MRIIIIGGAGFIGTSLALKLNQNNVKCMILDTPQRIARSRNINEMCIEHNSFDFFSASESIEKFIEPGDAIIHLASSTHPAKSMQDISYCAESNIISSIRLFEALRHLKVSRLVFASSGGTVYGIPEKVPIEENDNRNPINAYGVSKLAIEHYLDLFKELSGVSLRISNPYGSYQLQGTSIGLIAHIIVSIRNQQCINIWGDGSIVRDYIYIDDVIDAILLSLNTELVPPTAYNIGTGIGYSITDVISYCSEITGQQAKINYQESRSYDSPIIVLDHSRFSEKTNWSPKTLLKDGILKLVESCN